MEQVEQSMPERTQIVAEICQLLESHLAKDSSVVAVFLNGSQAIGRATPDSDVDFTVLVTNEVAVVQIQDRIADLFEKIDPCHGVAQYRYAHVCLCISIFPKSDVLGWVEDAFRSADQLLSSQAVLQHKFVESIPVLDPDGLLAHFQARLTDYPDNIAEEILSRSVAYLRSEYLDDWGFRNIFHYSYCLQDILEHIGQALYAKNRRFYMPALKRWPGDLPTLKPNLENELAEMVSISPGCDLDNKRQALERIISRLEDRTY